MQARGRVQKRPEMRWHFFFVLLVGLAAAAAGNVVQMRPRTREGMWLLDTGAGPASTRDGEHVGSWLVSPAAAVYLSENYASDVEVVYPPTPAEVAMRSRAMRRTTPSSAGDEENPFAGYSGPHAISSEIGELLLSPNFHGRLAVVGPSHKGVPVRGLTFARCLTGCPPKPRVALLGGIHGDEIVGGEVLLWFMRHLVTYGTSNAQLSQLLDSVDVTVVPMINPDAFLAGTRNTSQNYDMNRSFYPDRCGTDGNPPVPVTEVENLKAFLLESGFDAVVFLHGGALVVSTPYDDECTYHGRRRAAKGPEDKLYTYMGERFAASNTMIQTSSLFHGGVTNGAQWYSISGSAQSWALNRTRAVLSLTFEVSSNKAPPHAEIGRAYWNANLPALTDFLAAVRMGVYLTIRYPDGGTVYGARVNIATARFTTVAMLSENPEREGKRVDVREDGTLFRMLPPGAWMILVTAPGHVGAVRSFILTEAAPTATFEIVMDRVIIRR